jgi:hypothetical protein
VILPNSGAEVDRRDANLKFEYKSDELLCLTRIIGNATSPHIKIEESHERGFFCPKVFGDVPN